MKKELCIHYLVVIACCFLIACSQDPESSKETVGTVTGKVISNDSSLNLNDFQVRAYAFNQAGGKWKDSQPVNSTQVSPDGSYSINIPDGEYFFSLFYGVQNGPEVFHDAQHGSDIIHIITVESLCDQYALQIRDSDNSTIAETMSFSCDLKTIYVSINNTISNTDFDIRQTGGVTGRVTQQSDGSAFSQVTVSAIPVGGTSIAETQTDKNGMYTLSCLPIGDYYFKAKAMQKEYQTQYFKENNLNNVYYIEDTLPIYINSKRGGVDFRLKKGATVTGKIKSDDQRQPLKDVVVTAYSSIQKRITGDSIPSDAQGNYTIYGLPKLEYYFYAEAEPPYVSCWFNNIYDDSDDNSKYKLNISNAILYPDNDFDLKPPARILATIKDEFGNKLDFSNLKADFSDLYVYVNVYRASDSYPVKTVYSNNSANISDNGEIIIDNLYEAYRYKFEILTNDTRYAPVFYDDEITLASARAEDVYNGITRNLEFQLTEGGKITGRIEDINSLRRIQGVIVRATSVTNPSRIIEDQSNSYGEYTLMGLFEDNYRVQVLTEGTDYISEFYDRVYYQKDAKPIAVKNGETKPDIVFSLDVGSIIKGQVTRDNTGEPIANIPVYANDINKGLVLTSITDHYGNYQITGLPNGNDYSIQVDVTGTEYLPGSYSEDIPNVISLINVGEERIVHFTLKKRPKVSGTITCPYGETFNYSFMENLEPDTYELILVDDENKETIIRNQLELYPNDEKIIDIDVPQSQ